MSDLISRKAAIEAMEQRYCDIERVKKRPVTKGEQAIFLDMRGVVRSLPSWGCRMSDLISRQDAIEAIEEIAWYHQNRNREMVSGANSTEDQAWYKSQDIYAALEALPSAEAIHKPDYSYEAGMVRRLKEALSAEAAIGDYPNDLISRSALMEYCSNQKSKSIDNNDIARFPSAEARPTGEWIDIDNYYSMATCSHCHKVTMFEKWGEYIRPYNFCPNCGARMDKGGDSE